jgi:2-polyprenyl-6-methoxyphenol hydroxylase-like FAD-dependent oxidoreductase
MDPQFASHSKPQQVAIIGAGTAGLAAAIVLARQGHHITLFEFVEHLSPVGAGLLLQPAGLAVFAHLGVLDHSLTLGAKVTGLEGRLADGRLLVDSHYREAGAGLYGLGIHRATLCHVLMHALKTGPLSRQVNWRMGASIDRIIDRGAEARLYGQDRIGQFDATFDLIVVANGARSQLRPPEWLVLDRPYPWGAAWTIVPECLALDRQILHQFYDGSPIMMGILPTGAVPEAPEQRLSSIFWSLPTAQLNDWMRHCGARDAWLAEIDKRWPVAAQWLSTVIHKPEQWLAAQYRDVVMRRFGQGRIGVIGDAAHAMSPQLGQGANMALLDAWALGQAMQGCGDWPEVWQRYHTLRASSTHFYQWLSRQLTPLYQSDSCVAGWSRDFAFSWMYRIPYLRKEMAVTISGLKTGLFTGLKVEEVSKV